MKRIVLSRISTLILGAGTLLCACTGNVGREVSRDNSDVEIDKTWCAKLMPPHGGGVTGGDGSISIDLTDGRSLFMWGDSFFGDVNNDLRGGDARFVIGNTFTVLNADGSIHTLHGGNPKEPSAYIPATQEGEMPTWYWPGNGFVSDGILHLFMSKFCKTGTGTFDFKYLACNYFRLNASNLQVIDSQIFPAATVNGVHYGHAVMPLNNDVYIYGTRSKANGTNPTLHVAKGILKDGRIEEVSYWNGSTWGNDASQSQMLEGIPNRVSEQFSVFQLKGKTVLVTQSRVGNIKEFYSYISDSPVGPFRNEQLLYTVNEPNFDADSMMTYNAMAHPQYQKDGKILMCYNVNTYDLEKVFKKASLYQPRFFWIDITRILND